MAVTADLLNKIQDYRQQGYSSDEIVQGLAQSSNFGDVAKKVRAYSKGGFSPDEILQGIQSSPVAKEDAAKMRSRFMRDEADAATTAAGREKFIQDEGTAGTRIKETAKTATKAAMPYVRPVLEGGGAALGGIAGAGAGGLAGLGVGTVPGAAAGGVAGGALGYAMGKNLADTLEGDWAATPQEAATRTLADLATGATYEMGGQVGAKLIGAGLTQGAKAIQAAKGAVSRNAPAVTKAAIESRAGQTIAENMGEGAAYEKNAAEASKLNIPGYTPSLGEARNDPGLIKLQRDIASQPGKAAITLAEKRSGNQGAVRDYLHTQFDGTENIDDVVNALNREKEAEKVGTFQAEQAATTAQRALNPADPQLVGRNITESIDTALAPVKTAEREAWGKVPNYPIPTRNFDSAANELRNTPMVKSTESSVREILDFADRMPKTTEGMQSIERTINDKMFAPNADPNVKRVLGGLKQAVNDDFKAMSEAADKGDVALFDGKIVHPSRIQSEIDTLNKNIAEDTAKRATTPDIAAVRNAIKDSGDPPNTWMKQVNETDQQYNSRLITRYHQKIGVDVPMLAGEESKLAGEWKTRVSTLQNQLANLQPAEDIASAYKTAKQVSADRFNRFGKGAVADITQSGKQASGQRLPDSVIPQKIFTRDGADDFIRSVGQEEAARHADQFAAHDLLSRVNPVTGELPTKTIAAWLQKNMGVLRKYGISGKYGSIAKAQAAVDAARANESEFAHSVAEKLLGADPDKAIAAAMQGNAGMHGGGYSAKNTEGIISDLMNRIGNDATGLKGLRNAFKDFIVNNVETTAKTIEGDNIISPAAIQKQMAKYAPAMRKLYGAEPQKLAALQKVSKAVEIQSRSSKSPTGIGGSDTAEKINSTLGKIVNIIPGSGFAKTLGKWGLGKLNDLSAQEVNKVIVRALYDPELAQTLVLASQRAKPEIVAKRINSHLITMGLVASRDKENQ